MNHSIGGGAAIKRGAKHVRQMLGGPLEQLLNCYEKPEDVLGSEGL